MAGFLSRLRADDTPPLKPKPNSLVAGVQIGLNVPYSFANIQMSGAETLDRCVQLGIQCRGTAHAARGVVFSAHPPIWSEPRRSWLARRGVAIGGRPNAAMAFVGPDQERIPDFRRLYESAGVLIQIVKVDGIFKMTDAELDYVFELAKALGARAISTEISKDEDDLEAARRLWLKSILSGWPITATPR